MSDVEQKSFLGLAAALQSYAHDNPTRLKERKDELLRSLHLVLKAVSAAVDRRVVPDELLVLDTSRTLIGNFFGGLLDDGRPRRLTSATVPTLGQKVLYLSSAERDGATCLWTVSPWPYSQ
jgi:hypothetical protein